MGQQDIQIRNSLIILFILFMIPAMIYIYIYICR